MGTSDTLNVAMASALTRHSDKKPWAALSLSQLSPMVLVS